MLHWDNLSIFFLCYCCIYEYVWFVCSLLCLFIVCFLIISQFHLSIIIDLTVRCYANLLVTKEFVIESTLVSMPSKLKMFLKWEKSESETNQVISTLNYEALAMSTSGIKS